MGKLEDAISGSGFPNIMPSIPDMSLREKVACAARILANNGYALDIAGHITAMRPDGNMWCTPYGLWWREVSASDIIVLSPTGEVLEGNWDVTPAIYIHTEIQSAPRRRSHYSQSPVLRVAPINNAHKAPNYRSTSMHVRWRYSTF